MILAFRHEAGLRSVTCRKPEPGPKPIPRTAFVGHGLGHMVALQ